MSVCDVSKALDALFDLNYKAEASSRPLIMGILNVTPDSFSDGGRYDKRDAAKMHLEQMIEEGADIIDIGAESTRPGAKALKSEDEKERLDVILPLISNYKKEVLFSLDSRHLESYRMAFDRGIDMINDVSATKLEAEKISWLTKTRVPYVAMHLKGEPEVMQESATYHDVVSEVYQELGWVKEILGEGYPLILDPGIGFGKTYKHNISLLKHIDYFDTLAAPLLLGLSRKSFIGEITGAPLEKRLAGSLAAALYSTLKHVAIIRVHDVLETKQAIDVWEVLNT